MKIETTELPSLELEVKDNGETKTYLLCFPIPSVVRLEKSIGKPLKSMNDWLNLDKSDLSAVIEAGLFEYNPEVTAEQISRITKTFNAEVWDSLHYEICKLNFPKAMAKLEEAMAKRIIESPNASGLLDPQPEPEKQSS